MMLLLAVFASVATAWDYCGQGAKCNDQCWLSSGRWGRCNANMYCVSGQVTCGGGGGDYCGANTYCDDACWMGSQGRWGKCDKNKKCVSGPVQCGSAGGGTDVCGSGAMCNDRCWIGSASRWGVCNANMMCVNGPVSCGGGSDKALCQQPMTCGQACTMQNGMPGQCTNNWEKFPPHSSSAQWYRTCERYAVCRSVEGPAAALPTVMIVAVAAALLLAAAAVVYKVRSKAYAPLTADDEPVAVATA